MKENKSKIKKFFQSIFKIFFYTLFKLKHGTIVFDEKIQSKLFKEENVSFENKNITLVYSIFFSPNSRLYTDRIYDTAIIKNNLLVDKPSFQLRNNVNDDVTKNIVLKNGTPYIMRKLSGTTLSLLTGGGGNDNFFIGYLMCFLELVLLKKINLNEIDYYLCPNLNKWQLETLNLLGIKRNNVYQV